MSETPNVDPQLTDFVRTVMREMRDEAERQKQGDPLDRILAAATLVLAAIAFAWPKGKNLPTPASMIIGAGRQIWKRRNWWLP